MSIFSSEDGNRFEAKIKIVHNNNQKKLLEIINNYLKRFYKYEEYKLEKETQNILILNFKNNTDIANCVLKFLKIVKLEQLELSNIYCTIHIKIINSLSKKKNWNKSNLLLSSVSIDNNKYFLPKIKKERYKNYSKGKNYSTNNTKYNVIQKLYFPNINKNKIESYSDNNNNNFITENNLSKKKIINNNWLIQGKPKLDSNNNNFNINEVIEN